MSTEQKQKSPAPLENSEAWAIRELRLPSADAIDRIKSYQPITAADFKAGKSGDPCISGEIPSEDKDWIVRKIEKSGFSGVIINLHEHFHEGQTVMHGSVKKLY